MYSSASGSGNTCWASRYMPSALRYSFSRTQRISRPSSLSQRTEVVSSFEKVARREDDAGRVGVELEVVAPRGGDEFIDEFLAVAVQSPTLAVFAEGVERLLGRHLRDHRCVADGLQLHVAAILGSFQLDDDELTVAIKSHQVDPAPDVLEVAELLRDDE